MEQRDPATVTVGRNPWFGGIFLGFGLFIVVVAFLTHPGIQVITGVILIAVGVSYLTFPALRVTGSEVQLMSFFGLVTQRISYQPEEVILEKGKLVIGDRKIPMSAIALRSADIAALAVFFAELKLKH